MYVCAECGWAQPTPGACNDGTALTPIGDDLLLGTQLGPYRLARLLGVGGMGRVYKGVHPQIGSRVAIKVLSRECSDRPDLVERFFAEARAVNLANHEGIVNVLDLDTLPDGRPYIIMEFLDGAPLSAIIGQARARGQPLPIGSVVRIAVEVLDAVGAAHAKGIIHRDLKPDNLYITPGGRPKVLDFGIAKLQPELGGNSATHTGSLLGTPQYMAPEQAGGRVVDARADLYAIGCVLYECLTLERPFSADSLFELLRMQIHEPVRPPRQLRPELPPDLEHVLLIALAKQPEERFSAAAAMSQALQHATAQLPPAEWSPISPTGSMAPVRANPSWGARQMPSPVPPPVPPPHGATVPASPRAEPSSSSPSSPPPHPVTIVRTSSVGWIVVAIALLLVGGGITAALFATRGGPSPSPSPSPSPTTDVAAEPVTHHDTAKAKAVADDDAADRAMDKLEVHILEDVDKQMAAVTAQVRGAAAPAAVVVAPPPAPPAPTAPTAPTAPPPAVVAPTAAVAEAPPETDAPHSATGWVVRHDLRPYAGYDPKHVDIMAFLAFATAAAKREISDAELVRFDIDGVDATGHADLTEQTHMGMPGNLDVRFLSKAHMPPNPKEHKPFGFKWECEFRVIAEPGEINLRAIDMSCDDPPVRAPRCPVSDLWARAAAKIPAGKRLELDYRVMSGQPTWNVAIFGVLEEMYRDDCK